MVDSVLNIIYKYMSNTNQISAERLQAYTLLNTIKDSVKSIETLTESEKGILYSNFTQDFINSYQPYNIPTNKQCCNLDYRRKREAVITKSVS